MIGQEGAQEGAFQWRIPLQGQQHERRAKSCVTDGWNPANRHLFAGQVHQQGGEHGQQHCTLRGDSSGVQRQVQQVARGCQRLSGQKQSTQFGHGARRAERFG